MFTSDKPHYENVPFEIPSSWVWTTLGDIAEIITGNTPSKDIKEYYSGNIPFFKPTDLEQGIHTKYSKDRLTPLGFEQSRKLPANSVLVTCIGATIGKTGLTTVEGTCNQQINAIIPTSAILAKFLFYVCVSDYMQHEIKANASATTLPILNKGNFSKIAITIPPLQEQSRIVKSIEHWLSLVDCIEGNKENLQRTIREAKSKVLDLAIHGKLVPQDPNDEPACELLKRINPNAEITSDNGHYQKLPEGWAVCCLENVAKVLDNLRKPINSNERNSRIANKHENELFPYYGATGQVGFIDDYLVDGTFLLLGEDGAPFLDKYAIKSYPIKGKCWVNNHAHILEPQCDFDYLMYYLNHVDYKDYVNGSTRLKLTQSDMRSIIILLPPLTEQKRISVKVKYLFRLLDSIACNL